jgi:hypothetical protein
MAAIGAWLQLLDMESDATLPGEALPLPSAPPGRRRTCLARLARGVLFFNFLPMILVAVLSGVNLLLAFGLAAAIPVISFLLSIPMYRAGVFQVCGVCMRQGLPAATRRQAAAAPVCVTSRSTPPAGQQNACFVHRLHWRQARIWHDTLFACPLPHPPLPPHPYPHPPDLAQMV